MAKNSTKIEVDLKKLIEVFDERNTKYQGHTAAISVILGEDLNTALFTHYLKNVEKEKNVEILPYKVKTGWPGGHGPQLDRWIKVGKTFYQTEIKNWCCFQIGGYKLLLL